MESVGKQMIARKCDRCGEFYAINKKSLSGIATHERAENGVISGYLSYYDLCPECMIDFKAWLSGEEKQTGWISVEDRLPDQELLLEYWKRYSQRSVEVLVMIEGASHSTTLTWDGNRFSDDCHNEYEVTHWMPLPEPPGDSDAQA